MNWWDQPNEEFKCEHTHVKPVRFTKSNGVICVRLQCQRCGESQGERRKAEYNVTTLCDWNDDLRQSWRAQQNERREELRNESIQQEAEERQQESAQWWEKYSMYLRSKEWQQIRQAVLTRDNNLCQACLRNKAAHVHHLSYALYEKTGRSAAFELVAICRPCHEKIHPHMSEAQDDLTFFSPYLPQMAERVP